MAAKTLYSTSNSDKIDKLDKKKLSPRGKKLLKSEGISKRRAPNKRVASKG